MPRYIRFIALIALVLILIATGLLYRRLRSTQVVSGTPSGELAFTSDKAGMWDIYTLSPDGTLFNATGDGGGHDYFPSWAFSNDILNFLTSRSGEMGPAQVYPDGSRLRTLSILEAITTVFLDGRTDWDPTWSPDSSRIVWSSVRDLNLEIYVADKDGENRLRLTQNGARDWFPAWSPDGTRITFSSDRDGNENIYVINADGTNLTQLTDHPQHDFYAMWSMDGTKILFVSERNQSLSTGVLELFIMNPDGSDQRPLAKGERFTGNPTYNADGSQIAYLSNEEGRWALYVMDSNGKNVRRITDRESNALFPVWRPTLEGDAESTAETE